MIQFNNLRQYTHVVDGIRFPNKPGENFVVTYFSENSNFLDDYPKLNFRVVDIKMNIIPITIIPRTRIQPSDIKSFKKYGIYSYSSTYKISAGKNVFYDITKYLNAIDTTFHPSHYRQRVSMFIKNIVSKSFSEFSDFKKVLIYSIDLTKPFNNFIDRKFFPMMEQLKDGSFEYDHLILCLLTKSGPRYRLLIKDKNFKFQRIITILKSIKSGMTTDDEIETEEDAVDTDQVVDQVMDKIKNQISPGTTHQVADAVKNYVAKDKYTKSKVLDKTVSPKGMEKIGVASILYKVTGDMRKSKKITNTLTKKKSVMY